jgi:uncharacterized membrane protein
MYLSLCSREGNNKFKILKLKLTLEWHHTYNLYYRPTFKYELININKKKTVLLSISKMHCMLESNGQTLLVFLVSIRSIIIFVDGVEVFWLDIGKPTWIKMESPGDRSLFSRLEF